MNIKIRYILCTILLITVISLTASTYERPKIALKDIDQVLSSIYLKDKVSDVPGHYLFNHDEASTTPPVDLNVEAISRYLSAFSDDNEILDTLSRYEIRDIVYDHKNSKAIVLVDLFKSVEFRSGKSEKWFKQVKVELIKSHFETKIDKLTVLL